MHRASFVARPRLNLLQPSRLLSRRCNIPPADRQLCLPLCPSASLFVLKVRLPLLLPPPPPPSYPSITLRVVPKSLGPHTPRRLVARGLFFHPSAADSCQTGTCRQSRHPPCRKTGTRNKAVVVAPGGSQALRPPPVHCECLCLCQCQCQCRLALPFW